MSSTRYIEWLEPECNNFQLVERWFLSLFSTGLGAFDCRADVFLHSCWCRSSVQWLDTSTPQHLLESFICACFIANGSRSLSNISGFQRRFRFLKTQGWLSKGISINFVHALFQRWVKRFGRLFPQSHDDGPDQGCRERKGWRMTASTATAAATTSTPSSFIAYCWLLYPIPDPQQDTAGQIQNNLLIEG